MGIKKYQFPFFRLRIINLLFLTSLGFNGESFGRFGISKTAFLGYEKAFNALDIEKNAQFFADTFISAGPAGTITNSKAELLKVAQKAADFYRSVGQQSAKILSLEEMTITAEYSMVKVHWCVTFQKTGDRLIEFDVSYLIQKTGPEPKIILFISHQDEQKAMQELGLLK